MSRAEEGTSPGVPNPSFKVSWTPFINRCILPVLNKLDQEPREEFDDDNDETRAGIVGDGCLGHAAGETGLGTLVDFMRLK